MKKRELWCNRLGFGLGTVGRDMVATLVTMYMMFYLTDVLNVSEGTLGMLTFVIVFMRIFDGVNDPFMGTLVDNTKTPWGKFKPWIAGGAVVWALFHVLMFADFGLKGFSFVVLFTLLYLGWELSYTANDISFWSMIPALSRDQKEREKIAAVARIAASVGMFTLVVALIPLSKVFEKRLGSLQKAWLAIALLTAFLMLFFQAFTLIFVKEQTIPEKSGEHTRFRDLFKIIFKNDQLLIVTAAMLCFMAGYTATTGLGIYYFKYIFGNEDMYSVFAALLGVSQILGLALFPLLSKRLKRESLFSLGIALVVLGYISFFFAPLHMLPIGISGVLIFVGQAFIQILMLMFIADSVEYGQWKFGKRNESVSFSLQPLIYKCANGAASAVIGITLLLSGIKKAETAADVTHRGAWGLKFSMLLLPLGFVLLCYFLMKKYYKIDERFYARILRDNQEAEAEIVRAQEALAEERYGPDQR